MHLSLNGSLGGLCLHCLKLMEWFGGAASRLCIVILLTWHKEQLPVSGGEHVSREFRRLLGSLWEAAVAWSSLEALWVWEEKEEKGG